MTHKKKYLIAISFLISMLFVSSTSLFAGNELQQQVAPKDSLKNSTTVCYEVFGMDCPGCQSALEKQIKKIDGVADAKASYKDKEVRITIKPDAVVQEEEIHKRIKKANFTPGKKVETTDNE